MGRLPANFTRASESAPMDGPAQNKKIFAPFKFSPSDSALISEGCKKYTGIRSIWVQIKMIF
jgi:hypothetical protein